MKELLKLRELILNENNEENTPEQFVDKLYNKLRVSGYVYHPSKNFNILSALFLRKPDLMNNRIKELLEIIKEKDIQIWEREPFSSALIQLLELYIKECDGKIDESKVNEELINKTNAPVNDVLNDAFKGRSLKYSIVSEKSIVVSEKRDATPSAPQGEKKKIQGQVKDNNGDPIIGATISVVGTDELAEKSYRHCHGIGLHF